MEAVARAADIAADAIAAGGLAHLFGTGHSRIPSKRCSPATGRSRFPPDGGAVDDLPHQVTGSNGQRQAMFIERVEGLAEQILANFDLAPPDCMFVFSASGRSAVPIEMAMGARRRRLPVVAVVSLAQCQAAPSSHSSGTRLPDHADVVIDLGTPPADALVTLDGLDTPVGPGSSLMYATVVNEIKVQTAERLLERGAMPPVITSSAVVGEERSRALFEAAYADHARRYASRLRAARDV